ncbi:MAG: sugar transferase, partial [Ignavibacteria bacterium]|nr:sugar transferase [Ignavibacteria bacterium]
MGARKEVAVLLLTDFLTICGTWMVYYLVRVRSGWLDVSVEPELLAPMFLVYAFWVLVFFMVGLYRSWYATSRLDELALVFKTLALGCLFLFFVIFADDQGKNVVVSSRLLIAIYWGVLLLSVSSGRLAVRSIQRQMLIAGVGTRPTIIVGSATKARQLYDAVSRYPALGYRVIGFSNVGRTYSEYKEIPVLGGIDDLHTIIPKNQVKEVLIALDSSEHGRLLDII